MEQTNGDKLLEKIRKNVDQLKVTDHHVILYMDKEWWEKGEEDALLPSHDDRIQPA